MSEPVRHDLRDSYGFWLAAGGALLVLGGIPVGVTVPVAASIKQSPWESGWFIFGFVIAGLGAVCILWALILYIARRQAGQRWCPDPGAHIPPTSESLKVISSAPTAPMAVNELHASDRQWLRLALRNIKSDLIDAGARVAKAQQDSRYWNIRAGVLQDSNWRRNRRRISGLPGVGDTYDSLISAYEHVKRINSVHFVRLIGGGVIRPGDNLQEALAAIRAAETAVEKELAELG